MIFTSLTLGLQLVKNPGVLEGSLAGLRGLLLELLDGSLVDTSALVDQVTSGGGLARVDVSNDNNVDMSLFLAHGELLKDNDASEKNTHESPIIVTVHDGENNHNS